MVNGMGVRLMHFIRSYIDLLVHGVCEYDVDLLVEAAAGPYSGVPNKRDGKTCRIRAMKDILATEK